MVVLRINSVKATTFYLLCPSHTYKATTGVNMKVMEINIAFYFSIQIWIVWNTNWFTIMFDAILILLTFQTLNPITNGLVPPVSDSE